MPREWKLDILLRNLENDWESMIKMSFTVTSSYLNKDNMAPLTIHCEALPIGKRLNKIFWFQDPFSFSSHFSFLCAFDRRPPPDVWTANARDAERTPSAALKPRGWDERELGCYLHKSSVSSSPRPLRTFGKSLRSSAVHTLAVPTPRCVRFRVKHEPLKLGVGVTARLYILHLVTERLADREHNNFLYTKIVPLQN